MPRKKAKGPPERIVGLIESVRVEERPRRDPLVSLLITVVGGDGTGDGWFLVDPPLGVRLLALAEKEPLLGATRQFTIDDAGTIISVLVVPAS